MDEEAIQQRRREQDENATRERAAILGLQYLDTREYEKTLPLVSDVLTIDEMYKGYIVPLTVSDSESPYRFGVTSQTPQSLIHNMERAYNDRGENIHFFLISNSGFRAFMQRYDPPKEVIYDDIKIARHGDSDTISQVSKTLNSVASDQLFDYIISQADSLGASDIHIENTREAIRIRMRVDGALHAVAELEKDRYRVVMGELASRSNISTAATEPQSGHMQKEITRGDATHVLNIRVETVPTMHGQDAVLRLFNFDEKLLNLIY